MVGHNRCKMHGGKVPRMHAAPAYNGKGTSRYLPKNLRKEYERVMSDPNLLSVRDEIGLVQLRINQLAGEIEDVKTGRELFEQATQAWAKMKAAMAGGTPAAFTACRNEMDRIMEDGATRYQKWSELIQAAKDKAHLSRVEIESMVDMHAMISVERVVMMLTSLGDVVKRNVKDKAALMSIMNEMSVILGRREKSEQTETKVAEPQTATASDVPALPPPA
jgi:hypothetical protein